MNLSDLVAKAQTFAGAVAQDPQRYASAIQNGLAAIDNARAVFQALHATTSAAVAPLAPSDPPVALAAGVNVLPELADWKAIAETQEADVAVQDELRRDDKAITAEEVEDALVTVVKIVGLVGKAL